MDTYGKLHSDGCFGMSSLGSVKFSPCSRHGRRHISFPCLWRAVIGMATFAAMGMKTVRAEVPKVGFGGRDLCRRCLKIPMSSQVLQNAGFWSCRLFTSSIMIDSLQSNLHLPIFVKTHEAFWKPSMAVTRPSSSPSDPSCWQIAAWQSISVWFK